MVCVKLNILIYIRVYLYEELKCVNIYEYMYFDWIFFLFGFGVS